MTEAATIARGAFARHDASALSDGQASTTIVRVGDDPAGLADISQADVSLAIWRRPAPVAVPPSDLVTLESFRDETSAEQVESVLASALAARQSASWHAALAADAGALAIRFAGLIRRDRVAVRLDVVTDNACKKFHADYVTLRLLTTYVGTGTEWLVDDGEPPVVRRLAIGDVGLFKGRIWQPDARVLHRSPPIAGSGERRLLLVIDPR